MKFDDFIKECNSKAAKDNRSPINHLEKLATQNGENYALEIFNKISKTKNIGKAEDLYKDLEKYNKKETYRSKMWSDDNGTEGGIIDYNYNPSDKIKNLINEAKNYIKNLKEKPQSKNVSKVAPEEQAPKSKSWFKRR